MFFLIKQKLAGHAPLSVYISFVPRSKLAKHPIKVINPPINTRHPLRNFLTNIRITDFPTYKILIHKITIKF